ncbi:hypothetical protein [Paenibacillus naphthalenovorans]|uniref:hypothetical protein n=1 Tax=Paenibacillus naphthalenovorans TaxID=162209 RepID=UPI0014854DD7|nr:hypothetical protein [Paenibacillus naphthalenovorans]
MYVWMRTRGQSELWDRLALQANAAIRQRIELQCNLSHSTAHRLAGAYIQRHMAYRRCGA